MTDRSPHSVTWAVSDTTVPYSDAVAFMEERAGAIFCGRASEMVWLLEHPSLLTAGTRAKPEDLLDPGRLPVFTTGRGGEFTYHGPGQRVAYVMLDVRRRFGGDVRAFVSTLEDWVIATLARFAVRGRRLTGRTGVWVDPGSGSRLPDEAKIAALGLRIRRGVSFHGVALNVAPDLSFYDSIVPCGIHDRGVTSLAELGVTASLQDVDRALRKTFESLIAPVEDVRAPAGAENVAIFATQEQRAGPS